jgi:Holliday junction resolvase RusA-like endonuclease
VEEDLCGVGDMSAEMLTVQGRLIGMNDLINSARTNRFGSAKQKKDQMKIVSSAILMDADFEAVRYPARVTPHIDFYEPNSRRDADNVIGGGCKIIFDALVECGILVDDSRKYVSSAVCNVYTDKDNPRIEIRLIE